MLFNLALSASGARTSGYFQKSMAAVLELKRRIAEKLQRLQEGTNESKRSRKRIKQALGKLKIQLVELEASGVVDSGADEGSRQTAAAAAAAAKKQAKAEKKGQQKRFKKYKRKRMNLNKRIADFSRQKQLSKALKLFEEMREMPCGVDVHTYTNMINTYVRCAQMDEALKLLNERMPSDGVRPTVVTFTAILKGLCNDNNLGQAKKIFEKMATARPPVRID